MARRYRDRHDPAARPFWRRWSCTRPRTSSHSPTHPRPSTAMASRPAVVAFETRRGCRTPPPRPWTTQPGLRRSRSSARPRSGRSRALQGVCAIKRERRAPKGRAPTAIARNSRRPVEPRHCRHEGCPAQETDIKAKGYTSPGLRLISRMHTAPRMSPSSRRRCCEGAYLSPVSSGTACLAQPLGEGDGGPFRTVPAVVLAPGGGAGRIPGTLTRVPSSPAKRA